MTLNIQKLFLLDGLGAVVSAFCLGFLLVQLEPFFGMPAPILYVLAGIAGVCAFYSLVCYTRITQNERFYLTVIATANLLYCCLTVGLVVYTYSQLTILGLTYFLLELFIIIGLVAVELKYAWY